VNAVNEQGKNEENEYKFEDLYMNESMNEKNGEIGTNFQ